MFLPDRRRVDRFVPRCCRFLSRNTLIESGYQFSPGDRCGSRCLIGKSKGVRVTSYWPLFFCLCCHHSMPAPTFVYTQSNIDITLNSNMNNIYFINYSTGSFFIIVFRFFFLSYSFSRVHSVVFRQKILSSGSLSGLEHSPHTPQKPPVSTRA